MLGNDDLNLLSPLRSKLVELAEHFSHRERMTTKSGVGARRSSREAIKENRHLFEEIPDRILPHAETASAARARRPA